MDSGVGTILREARNRRKVELSEVEAATRIRLRYLRAIEEEEWDVLPGGFYTRGFVRTYAAFLRLDGERLVEDYRSQVERWHRSPTEQAQARASGGEPSSQRRSAPVAGLIVAAVLAVAVIAIVAIPSGDGGESGQSPAAPTSSSADKDKVRSPEAAPRPKPGVSVRLAANAEVWVCVLGGEGKELVDGLILEAGGEEGPFHSGSFTVSFGNGEVTMLIDGREADIAETSSPIGYAIDSSGRLTELDEAERPTCT